MPDMKTISALLVLLLGFTFLSACAPAQSTPTSQPDGALKLTPYHTATFTPTITPTPEGLPTGIPTPSATPTPRIYKVQSNDTLIGIANYFGLTLAELQAANPGVQPALLSIGTELIIPAVASAVPAAATAAPPAFAVTLREPVCVLSLTGGYHCYVLVVNEEDFSLENLSAEISLSDAAGNESISRQVELPLNQLAAGASLPFYTYFAPPVFADAQVSVKLTSVTRASDENNTVFPLVLDGVAVSMAADGASATASGSARLAVEGTAAGRYTLVAVAYDASGRVVGLRRMSGETSWGSGDEFEFTISVYSTGGVIDRVEVFGEAE